MNALSHILNRSASHESFVSHDSLHLGTEAVWVMAPMSVGGGGASCSI